MLLKELKYYQYPKYIFREKFNAYNLSYNLLEDSRKVRGYVSEEFDTFIYTRTRDYENPPKFELITNVWF